MDPFAADATLARPFATEADARLQRVRNELVSSDEQALRAVARAAGLHASRLDGSPLVYNRPDPYLPDLIVCRKELAPELLSVCTPAPRYDP